MDACRTRMGFIPVTTQLLRSRMFAAAVLTLVAVDMCLLGGSTATVAATAEQTNGDQLASPSSDSGLSWSGSQADDRSRPVGLPFDVDDTFSPRYSLSATDESDAAGPVRLPQTRRAASSGLRLIGLGKRPSGAGGGNSPLRYIGLGRKRASAIKYIGLGRRSDGQQQDLADSHGAEMYDNAAAATAFDENNNDDGQRLRGGSRRRRDLAMRLIGIGRRSDNYHPSRHFGSRSMTLPIDEDDLLMSDEDRQEMAELGLPWHQVTRRAGGDGTGLRRMQLRRWSASSSSSTGSHVDPAMLAMGIGK